MKTIGPEEADWKSRLPSKQREMVKLSSLWKISFSSSLWHPNATLGPIVTRVSSQEPPQKWFSFRKRDERGWKSTLSTSSLKSNRRGLRCGHFDTSTDLVTLFMQIWQFFSWTHFVKSNFKEQSSWCVLDWYLASIHEMIYRGSNTCVSYIGTFWGKTFFQS